MNENDRDRHNSDSNAAAPTRREFIRTVGAVTIASGGWPDRVAESRTEAFPGAGLLAPSGAAAAGDLWRSDEQPDANLFSAKAKWIWENTDRGAYHRYVEARKRFRLEEPEFAKAGSATLTITADAYYQAWLNGRIVGAGPAKSAEGRRSVDRWPIAGLLAPGVNELRVLVLSMGTGTLNYCPGEAGLIFEIRLEERSIPSDAGAEFRFDQTRARRTARRWVMPCLEDVDAGAVPHAWKPATEVKNAADLYLRRVPLPTRQVLTPKRVVKAEYVRVPNVSVSMRLRPYLNDGEEKRHSNPFETPAYLVTDIISPIDQDLVFTPTLGNVTWYFHGRQVFVGSGWSLWQQTDPPRRIRLAKGSNRLVAVHNRRNHFEDISLAGFVDQPVRFTNPFGRGGFQVVRLKGPGEIKEGQATQTIDWTALQPGMPDMDPSDTMPFGNAYDLVYGAEYAEQNPPALTEVLESYGSDAIVIPAAPKGQAFRLIVDLGVLHEGSLAFDVDGRRGSTLIFAMFEALDPGPPMRIQWPNGCNNALTYRLPGGRRRFESFFPYGVRYIAIQHTGEQPVRLSNLRVLTVNCGSTERGSLLTSNELMNSIYRICAQSVISGVNDTFTDCPTYEQVNWNFDNHTASLGDAVTCANYAVQRNSIELFAEDPHYKGLVRSQYPSTWDSQIPLWSFHWLMWCRDFYWETADTGFVRRIMPRVAAGIEEGLGRIGSRGLLVLPGVWHFIEWGHGRDDDHDIMSAEQAGFVGALEAAIELAEVVDGPGGNDAASAGRAERWRRARQELIRAINANLWDAAREAYFDSLHGDGSPSAVTSQTTNAAMAVYGVAPPDRTKDLAKRILQGDPKLLPYGSPLGLYYILEMLDGLGDSENLFRLIRERWGEMVLEGDTSTWETFAEFGQGGWPTRSRCHPFAAYVAKYMARYLLGVQALKPGFARFRVEPKPPSGINRCRGSVPTPKGLILVGWERQNGQIRLSVEQPNGVVRV